MALISTKYVATLLPKMVALLLNTIYENKDE